MSTKRWWALALGGSLAVSMAGTALAQGSQQPGPQPRPGPATEEPGAAPRGQPGAATPGVRQLSPASQNAVARLHALTTARASYARAGAEMAQDEEAKSFFRMRAQDYEQANTRLSLFARNYGVDLQSEEMKKKTKQTLAQWQKENDKLRDAKPEQVAGMVLSTFIERNDDAIDDLRQLRGEVQEDELRQLINQRIASIEEESTRAQQLRQRLAPTEAAKTKK